MYETQISRVLYLLAELHSILQSTLVGGHSCLIKFLEPEVASLSHIRLTLIDLTDSCCQAPHLCMGAGI